MWLKCHTGGSSSRLAFQGPRRSVSSTQIVFEDILPEESLAPQESSDHIPATAVHKRFYVPAPFTDEQLERVSPADIAEWPKSRVVWGLGRIGYSSVFKTDRTIPLNNALIERAATLICSMNTRDLVRLMQAAAYGVLCPNMHHHVKTIRKQYFINIANSNELFLASFVYGHLKLVNRANWVLTDNCHKATEFLLSEIIQRKNKIYAPHMLDIATALLTSKDAVFKQHSELIKQTVEHAVTYSIRHTKQAVPIEQFSKALVGHKCDEYFQPVNEAINAKFKGTVQWRSARDALNCGVWFFMNGLLAPATVDNWLTAIRNAKDSDACFITDASSNYAKIQLIQYLITQPEFAQNKSLIGEANIQWMNSLVETMPIPDNDTTLKNSPLYFLQESRIIERMAESVLHEKFESVQSGPFFLPVCFDSKKLVVEWDQPWTLVSPYKRKLSNFLATLRRRYLEAKGWIIVGLDINSFRASTVEEKTIANQKFASILKAHGLAVKEAFAPPPERSIGRRTSANSIADNQSSHTRIRRECKRTENSLKASLKRITKSWISTHKRKTRIQQRKTNIVDTSK